MAAEAGIVDGSSRTQLPPSICACVGKSFQQAYPQQPYLHLTVETCDPQSQPKYYVEQW